MRHVLSGELEAFKIGRRWFTSTQALQRWIERRSNNAVDAGLTPSERRRAGEAASKALDPPQRVNDATRPFEPGLRHALFSSPDDPPLPTADRLTREPPTMNHRRFSPAFGQPTRPTLDLEGYRRDLDMAPPADDLAADPAAVLAFRACFAAARAGDSLRAREAARWLRSEGFSVVPPSAP